MAGAISNGATFWNVGEATGQTDAGASTSLPVADTAVTTGTDAPSAAPKGAPIFLNTANHDIYVWMGTAWDGPYNKGT